MIEVQHVTKRHGRVFAVDNLSFSARPGRVTGFVGPNGAGKSTTMRVILGLTTPDSGRVTIAGVGYHDLVTPLRTVGALLDDSPYHPGRTGRNHLLYLAVSNGIPGGRVAQVLEQAGLTSVADRRVKTYSLGMRQRLGLAAALLGDPGVLVLDEPTNGLDPEGIVWLRTLLRTLAGEGRTIFLSSHLMSEMAMVADHLVLIGQGRLIGDISVAELIAMASGPAGAVRTLEEAYLELTHRVEDFRGRGPSRSAS